MKRRRYKVAYVIDGLSYGGAERQLTTLARALPEPFIPAVVSLSERLDPFGDQLMAEGVEVVAVPRHSHLDLRRLWGTTRVLSRIGADIVHGFLDAANAYAYLSARVLRKPVILSLRNEMLRVSGARAALLSWMLRHCECVLVNSKAGAEFLRSNVGVRSDDILRIPNWIDPERVGRVRQLPAENAPKTVVFVGRFARQKRLHLLVDAFHNVLDKIPDARLVLMGDGSEHEMLDRRTRDLGITRSVEFIPPHPDIDGTLRRGHLFALTSGFEGLPNAAIEALAMGIPIAASPVGDVGELIIDGRTGVFFDEDAPEAMAKTIVAALSNRTLLENAVTDGPKLVEESYSLEGALEKLTAAYHTLLDR